MKAKFLQPFILKDAYFEDIERQINNTLYNMIFKPLFAVIKKTGVELKNSQNETITEALKSGKIYYSNGEIHGKFNASISKYLRDIGATFNAKTKTWHLSFLPAEMQIAIAEAESLHDAMKNSFIKTLDSIDTDSIVGNADFPLMYNKTLLQFNDKFQDIVKKIAIPPKMTEQARQAIAASWGENLELYIKDWADESILKLRTQIQINTMAGGRAESMVKSIIAEYGVSRRKAKFLARQETALLMSKYQEERFKDVGVTKYRWSASMDKRTRDLHKNLNGKIFLFSNPPISGSKGERQNAGEPFGCRCVCVAIAESAL